MVVVVIIAVVVIIIVVAVVEVVVVEVVVVKVIIYNTWNFFSHKSLLWHFWLNLYHEIQPVSHGINSTKNAKGGTYVKKVGFFLHIDAVTFQFCRLRNLTTTTTFKLSRFHFNFVQCKIFKEFYLNSMTLKRQTSFLVAGISLLSKLLLLYFNNCYILIDY